MLRHLVAIVAAVVVGEMVGVVVAVVKPVNFDEQSGLALLSPLLDEEVEFVAAQGQWLLWEE